MMAAGRRKRVRFTLDVTFESEVAKQAFSDKLTAVRNLLTPRGANKLDNHDFLLALFDCAVNRHQQQHSSDTEEDLTAPTTGSFLRNSGRFTIIIFMIMLYILQFFTIMTSMLYIILYRSTN